MVANPLIHLKLTLLSLTCTCPGRSHLLAEPPGMWYQGAPLGVYGCIMHDLSQCMGTCGCSVHTAQHAQHATDHIACGRAGGGRDDGQRCGATATRHQGQQHLSLHPHRARRVAVPDRPQTLWHPHAAHASARQRVLLDDLWCAVYTHARNPSSQRYSAAAVCYPANFVLCML